MKIHLKRTTAVGQSMLFMMPWLPLEIIEDNYATINYEDIITVVEPKKNLVEHYNNTIEEIEAKIHEEEKIETEDDNDVDEDTMQEMLNALRESKKNKLH
jgi:UTP-glucose-1-phosphate uridylyltransferase